MSHHQSDTGFYTTASVFNPRFLIISIRLLLLIMGVMLLSGCMAHRLTDFTDQIRRGEYQLSDEELQRIQFYTSHELILTAVDEDTEDPARGIFRRSVLDTRLIDQVVIRRHTRGVVVAAGERWLDVSFQEGDSLRFTLMPSGRYLLNASTVMYSGQQYRVECIPRRFRDCPVSLLIRKNVEPKITVRSQRARGLRP